MEFFKPFWIRIVPSLLVALAVNLAILFVIPPTTTFGIIVKDVVSLSIAALIYFKILYGGQCD